MPTMYCPGCGKAISAEEKAAGACPGCGKPLPGITSAAVPSRSSVAESAWASPRRRPDNPVRVVAEEGDDPVVPREVLGWGTVRAGLALTVVGSILFFACAFVLFTVKGVAVPQAVPSVEHAQRGGLVGERAETNALTVVVGFLGSLGLVAALVLVLAGMCMGCAAPEDSGARGWAIGVSALLALSIVLTVVLAVAATEIHRAQVENLDRVMSGRPPVPTVPTWGPYEVRLLLYGLCAAAVAAAVFYLLFLRGVARHFHRDSLALGVGCFLAFFGLFCAGVLLLATQTVEVKLRPAGGESMLWVVLGALATVSVWFVVLVGMVRGAVTRGILKS